MVKLRLLALATSALVAAPALAQTAPAAPPATASDGAATAITDAELTMFAKAALASDAVSKDPAVPAADKPAKMTEAVTATGLDTARFNEIAGLAQTDPMVREKVQAAIIAVRDGTPAAAPSPAASPTPMQSQ
ncbi:hypothetical protein J2Y54_002428 [Sphingomonas sp. BE123]|uniref:DUF4168 domain-containing protein n=1 Tax=Sphingomonas sp. BE123 TaxID=2817842 RepID=UPI00285B0F4A|nr:DUF4168 domain-containing protein [Sphingomonas sp. BE123]MDR6852908.1 hypothetical protein [Sphingomonas sp. BE123]